MSQRLSRLTAPLTGLLFVGLTLAGVAMSNNTPSSDASGASVIAFYEAHRNSQRVSDILLVFASLFLVFFAGSLRGYLRRKPAAEAASALVPVGAALLAVGLTVVSGIDYALADVPSHLGAGAAQALNVLDNDVFFTVLVGGGVFGIASAVAILRGATLPKWLGWVAVVLGIAMMTPAFWLAGIVLFVWVLIVSTLIYVRSGSTTATPTPAVAES
jgi:hypothetical protein